MKNKNCFAQKTFAVLFSFALILPGCGGGGGGGGSGRAPDVFHNSAFVVGGPAQTPSDAKQAPIIDFDGTLHIGAGVEPDRNQLSTTGEHGNAAISSGHVRDGAGRDAVVAFNSQFFFTDKNKALRTFRDQPVVRVPRGTSAAHTELVVRAVQILNAYLPRENRMIFSGIPAPPVENIREFSDGEIYIGFISFGRQIPENYRTHRGIAYTTYSEYVDPEIGEKITEVIGSHISINLRRLHQFTDEANITLVAHELMHALAFEGHPSSARYPDSLMRSRVPRGFSRRILGPIDRDVFAAAFEYLPWATSAEEIGPWSDTSFHLRGDLGDVSFGVASFNGLLQPWASGPSPATNLADNQALSGSVSWTGRLLGFTSQSQSLAGAADLTISLATLRGRIDFTGLEHWGVNAAPGPVGSGRTWNEGDLNYSVIVRGNTFTQTGGDAGEVTGAFFGALPTKEWAVSSRGAICPPDSVERGRKDGKAGIVEWGRPNIRLIRIFFAL